VLGGTPKTPFIQDSEKNFKSLWSVSIPDSIQYGSIQENQGGRSGRRQNHFPNGEAEKNTQAAST
jgi:hypothetical protein